MQVTNGSKNRNCSVSIVFLNKSLVLLHHPGRQNLSALAYSWNLLSKVGKVVPHFWDIVPNLDKAGTNLLARVSDSLINEGLSEFGCVDASHVIGTVIRGEVHGASFVSERYVLLRMLMSIGER